MIIHVGFDLIVDNGQRISVSKTNKDWTEKLCFMTWREGWKEGAIMCELLDCLDSNSIWFVGLNIRRITVSKKNLCFKNNPDIIIIIIIRAKSRDPSGLKSNIRAKSSGLKIMK